MELKVLTYNIQHGLDYIKLLNKERVINLDKIINVIKKYNPDIIGLNEVYNDIENKISVEQVKYIANKLGYKYYYFGRAITIYETIDYGNAIISKYPIDSIKLHMIDDPIIKDENVHYETRSIIESKIKINNELLNVIVTHLGLATSERISGVSKLISIIKDEKTILMGDLNMEEDNSIIKTLETVIDNTSYLIQGNKLTFPSINPIMKIDYIFGKKIKSISSNVLKDVGSDHLPVLSIFNIN